MTLGKKKSKYLDIDSIIIKLNEAKRYRFYNDASKIELYLSLCEEINIYSEKWDVPVDFGDVVNIYQEIPKRERFDKYKIKEYIDNYMKRLRKKHRMMRKNNREDELKRNSLWEWIKLSMWTSKTDWDISQTYVWINLTDEIRKKIFIPYGKNRYILHGLNGTGKDALYNNLLKYCNEDDMYIYELKEDREELLINQSIYISSKIKDINFPEEITLMLITHIPDDYDIDKFKKDIKLYERLHNFTKAKFTHNYKMILIMHSRYIKYLENTDFIVKSEVLELTPPTSEELLEIYRHNVSMDYKPFTKVAITKLAFLRKGRATVRQFREDITRVISNFMDDSFQPAKRLLTLGDIEPYLSMDDFSDSVIMEKTVKMEKLEEIFRTEKTGKIQDKKIEYYLDIEIYLKKWYKDNPTGDFYKMGKGCVTKIAGGSGVNIKDVSQILKKIKKYNDEYVDILIYFDENEVLRVPYIVHK